MFAMRRWLNIDLDLHSSGLGPAASTAAGMLPIATLPLIAGVLGAFYEADNTPSEDDKEKKGAKGKDGAAAKGKVRVVEAKGDEEEEESDEGAKKAKK